MKTLFAALIVALGLTACAPAYGPPAPPAPPGYEPPPMTPAPAPGPGPGRPTAGLGQACGGMMGVACADPGAYCQIPMQNQCGAADGMGVCTMPPQACTREYAPVCGCDGETYANACVAASNSASVAYRGECR